MFSFLFIVYSIYILLFIVNIFLQLDLIYFVMGLFGILALIFSYRGANGTYKLLSIVFFIVSAILFYNYDLSFSEIPYYFTSMGLLLSLLYMVPFINHLITVGKYDQNLYRIILSNTENLSQFYRRVSITNYILVIFIFFSALPIVYNFVQEKLKKYSEATFHRFASESILRSFASVNVWNPIEVYIALTLSITAVSYLSVLPILIGFSLLILFIDWILALKYRHVQLDDVDRCRTNQLATKTPRKHILSLVLFLVLFMLIASSMHLLINITFFESVIIVILPYTVTWAIITGRLKDFINYSVSKLPDQTKTMQNFMFLFISLGVFNRVIEETGLFHVISDSFNFLVDKPLILLIGLQLSALFLAYIGVHPLVTISLQGLFLAPFLGVVNPVSISIVMITSTLAADASGTFNVPITMLSQYMERNPYQLTWWNFGYSLLFGFVGVMIAFTLL